MSKDPFGADRPLLDQLLDHIATEQHTTTDGELRAVLALMECVHCGWPKGDPNGCRFFCATEHDYSEHAFGGRRP